MICRSGEEGFWVPEIRWAPDLGRMLEKACTPEDAEEVWKGWQERGCDVSE